MAQHRLRNVRETLVQAQRLVATTHGVSPISYVHRRTVWILSSGYVIDYRVVDDTADEVVNRYVDKPDDIRVERAVLKDGKVERPTRLSVKHNGILVQENREFGGTQREGKLGFQDHGNPVRYRNIWYEPLP